MIVHLEPVRWEDWPPSSSILPCCGARVDEAAPGLVTSDPALVTCRVLAGLTDLERASRTSSIPGYLCGHRADDGTSCGRPLLAPGPWEDLEDDDGHVRTTDCPVHGPVIVRYDFGELDLGLVRRELQERSPAGNRFDLFLEEWSRPARLADGSWVQLESGPLEIGYWRPGPPPRWRRLLLAVRNLTARAVHRLRLPT